MIIYIEGEYCTDGCPFFQHDLEVDGRSVVYRNAVCKLSGHRCYSASSVVIDIRPKESGKVWEDPIERPEDCPFVNGQSVEIRHK